jgi:peptidoglycan hydrolase-like protein with peptidoglycan-binding domain
MKTRTAMNTWMTALALAAAGTLLATSAFAQSGAGSSPTSTGTDVKSGTDTKSGTAPPASKSNSSTPAGSTAGSTGSDMKSGAMGSGGKSDAMKSGSSELSARSSGNPEQVKAVQQALKDKGQDPGDVDGRMGPKTQAALRDFQQKEGLKATGRADAETMAKLGVEAKTGAVDSSSSSPAALPSGTGASKDATSTGAKQAK